LIFVGIFQLAGDRLDFLGFGVAICDGISKWHVGSGSIYGWWNWAWWPVARRPSS
jgi:hypothetical protein